MIPSTPSTVLMEKPPAELMLIAPLVEFSAATLVPLKLIGFVAPIPVPADRARFVAVMVLLPAVASMAPPVVRCRVVKPGLNAPATLIPLVLLVLPIWRVRARLEMLAVVKFDPPKSIRLDATPT